MAPQVSGLFQMELPVRQPVREARSEKLMATTLLNSAVLKASYPSYEAEKSALSQGRTP